MNVINPEFLLNLLPVRIWEASWQATLLAVIILIVQWALRSRLSARWRNALWLLVFARLFLPALPHARFSAYNWLPRKTFPAMAAMAKLSASPGQVQITSAPLHDEDTGMENNLLPPAPAQQPPIGQPSASLHRLPLLALLWMAGALVVTAWSVVDYVRLRKRVKKLSENVPGILKDQFAAAKALLGVRCAELIVTKAASTPFVTGFWRAKVILPAELETRLQPEDIRMVTLHELAHVKRGDLWMAWLSWLVATLHWFNPAIRFAMGRARKDREMACDEWVLRFISDSKGYGTALIRFLEFSQNPPLQFGLGIIGIFENKSTLVQRIRRIATYRRPTLFGSAFGIAALVAIGVFTLTAAPADAPALQLMLELSDGSRIIGTPSVDRLKMTTEYSELEIRLPLLRAIEFSGTNHAAKVSLQNGDLLNGRLAATEISLKTIFGQVVIPVTQVRKIGMATDGGALPDGAILYDIAGYWNSNGSAEYADIHREGKHVVYTFNTGGYTHAFEGDYVDAQTIEGTQTRRNLTDGTTTRMHLKIKMQSTDSTITEWTALDSNSGLVKGQTGTAVSKRVTPPQP